MMERSWLIQRMQKPRGEANPFSFGGGGSGFSKDTEATLAAICSWDYMGASEYEFGAPAKALNRMIMDNKKIAGAIKVSYKYDRPQWLDKIAKQFVGEDKVFYICPKEEVEEVETRIAKFAKDYKHNDTRDSVNLDEALAGEGSEHSKCCGWFDIDNDFMFFTDEKMWRAFCESLDVKVLSKKQMSKI